MSQDPAVVPARSRSARRYVRDVESASGREGRKDNGMSETLTVGVLGTGIMGAAMARNLIKAGHTVRVWNRSPGKAEPLAGDGAVVAPTPAEAVRDADVVITMLYDGDAVRDVMRDAFPAARNGAIWVQSTTVSLEDVDRLAADAADHGFAFFDTPVLGTRQPAEAGQLTVLAAGPAERRDEVTPIFDAVGARTVWLDQPGAATRLKLVANSWVLALTHAGAETLSLAEALGVDPDKFLQVIEGGPLDNAYLRTKVGLVRGDKLSPAAFAVTTAEKDARLIAEAGRQHGVRLDLAEAGAERFRRAAEQGHGDKDMAASYYASFEKDEGTAAQTR
ncbi:NAD(P)-dependent oxidoreductase [Actinoplanes sp. Pm04-4]|uniref:NAD(P)-dependent oxidoreductase n=1 Tax=Paractinoplanes pyxinae TaxID=2997416 RepID=A0ABT4AXF9_9ACTN|nr:NAD(P)-dependent oxidoreductase [Actinoplanes pyxinae]MCY1138919.1 NAD(P)-dependent oxidoreductase [Actinoplanes pyxinae]